MFCLSKPMLPSFFSLSISELANYSSGFTSGALDVKRKKTDQTRQGTRLIRYFVGSTGNIVDFDMWWFDVICIMIYE